MSGDFLDDAEHKPGKRGWGKNPAVSDDGTSGTWKMPDKRKVVPAGFKNAGQYLDSIAEQVMEEVERGVAIRVLAKRLGVGKVALYSWLRHPSRRDRVAEVRRSVAADMLDAAKAELDEATPENISVVRERVRFAMWCAERMDRETWGGQPSQAVQINIQTLGDALRQVTLSASSLTVEQEPDGGEGDAESSA